MTATIDPEVRDELRAGVRRWVEREVLPVASEFEHADEYPADLVEGMKAMGLFGITIPEELGGLGLDLLAYIAVVEELAAGWMSLSGIVNTHTIAASVIMRNGTPEQQQRWLPRLATGELRGCLSLSESDAGSDTRNITCKAVRDGDEYVITGTKMWVTNGERAGLDRARGAHRRRHHVLHRREGAGPDVRRHHRLEEHRQARVQGHRDRRDGLRRPPRRRGLRARRRRRARPRARLDPRRARGRADQHRGRVRAAWRGPRSKRRSGTRRSAGRSASRSPSTRPSSRSSPTWRRSSRPRAC